MSVSAFFTNIGTYASNETGLLKVTDYNCGCPGQNMSYLCTTVGGVYTVWGGTALTECSVGNKINLRHNEFDNAAGECNNILMVQLLDTALE